MKTFLHVLLWTVLFHSIVLGNITEPSVYTQIESEQNFTQEINITNENFDVDPNAKKLFLSYEDFPKQIYKNQIFPIKLKAIIAADEFDDIQTSFSNEINSSIINPQSKWQWYSDNIFFNTFYIKVSSLTSLLPDILVTVNDGFDEVESSMISSKTPKIVELSGNEKYTGIIAKSLHVKKYKTSRFDDNRLIMVLEIASTYANLKKFKINNIIKGGVDSSYEDFPNQRIFYYAIFENYRKNISFSYFDLEHNKFQSITLPVILDKDDVSTQLGLNPKESQFTFYKSIALIVSFFIFLTLFFVKSKKRYLLIALIVGAYFLYENNPLGTLKIKSDTNLRILPTQKSTVFYQTDRILYVERLGKRDEYIKVLFPNGKIGWIKESDVISH